MSNITLLQEYALPLEPEPVTTSLGDGPHEYAYRVAATQRDMIARREAVIRLLARELGYEADTYVSTRGRGLELRELLIAVERDFPEKP